MYRKAGHRFRRHGLLSQLNIEMMIGPALRMIGRAMRSGCTQIRGKGIFGILHATPDFVVL
jgi:hypothetical protein